MDKKEYQVAIGKRIKQLREKKNISQVELAALCNFEKSNMSSVRREIPILLHILCISLLKS
ncbi:hypothetical protein [Chryseobacterium indoltheticum]|uniref:hypothetical protein n=1 Tax=Chryseobacterium indoltheticum TaxID=254 RepID=UPI003F49B11C